MSKNRLVIRVWKVNLVKARNRKNENEAERYHAQWAAAKGEAQRAAAMGLVKKWTCNVCKSCSFDTFEKAVAHESQCAFLWTY